MFADLLIPRLRAAGLTVTDVRNLLPRNGTWMTRPLSAIKRIAHHYDADFRPHSYDTLARLKRQAQYHINKDWGGGAHGDGLMYAISVDNVGEVFICRNFEEVTWHVGNPNYSAVATKYDCGGDQDPTREQIEAMAKITNVLTTKCPEFPAGRAEYFGHKEFAQFGGTATACPGKFMAEILRFRETGKVDPTRYAYDWPVAPAPTPPPAPDPTPQPPADNRPEWEKNAEDLPEHTRRAVRSTALFNIETGAMISIFRAGDSFQIARQTSARGVDYFITKYSADKNIWNGLPASDLTDQAPSVPVPEPTPPAPEPEPQPEPPAPEPEPQPEPEPTPEPIPEPTPVPAPVKPKIDPITALILAGLLGLLGWILGRL
jgi:hypothetical protein